MGTITAIISGLLMSVQGVWNTRVTEKAGIWFTNSIVHLVGLITAVTVLLFVRDANLDGIKAVNKVYLLGGLLGAGIVYTVILSISKMGPAQATMIILIAQILGSYMIELFGLFGTEKVTFQWTKVIAVGLMIAGIVIFKLDK